MHTALSQHSGSAASPLAVEELSPCPDAWELAQRLAGLPHLLLLESAVVSAPLARYSFLTADPVEWLWSRGRTVWSSQESRPLRQTDPFAAVAERLAYFAMAMQPHLPPFQGGAAGLFGYDLCHHLERLPRPPHDEFAVPDLAVGIYDWVIGFDHLARRAWLMATGYPERDPRRRRQRARRRLEEVVAHLEAPPQPVPYRAPIPQVLASPQAALPQLQGLRSNFTREQYLDAVRRAIEYIHAGDCFQVNLAQRLLYPATSPPLELYGRLRDRNPAPFAGYLDLGDFTVASASPERFLRLEDGEVETRPIKGTRPRGFTPAEDFARREDLLESAKDRAENVMIVDLLRNDLGRVCEYGSVRVEAVCRLESYQYVHHLVSEVRGRLREGLGPIDLLRAAFPGGSVTGAPKIRAMEIIAELEPTARGPYCGSLGYIGFDGAMDTNLLIRTFTIGKGWIQFPVGGGIVADSDPEREYEETLHKAEGLLRALR